MEIISSLSSALKGSLTLWIIVCDSDELKLEPRSSVGWTGSFACPVNDSGDQLGPD